MAEKLTISELSELKEAFSLFDKLGNETISTKSLGQLMRTCGQNPTESELQDTINEVDDGTGTISFPIFLYIITKGMKKEDTEDEIREAFRAFDRDGYGFILPAELKQVLRMLDEDMPDKELDNMMKIADKDGDGVIDYEEFAKMISPK